MLRRESHKSYKRASIKAYLLLQGLKWNPLNLASCQRKASNKYTKSHIDQKSLKWSYTQGNIDDYKQYTVHFQKRRRKGGDNCQKILNAMVQVNFCLISASFNPLYNNRLLME